MQTGGGGTTSTDVLLLFYAQVIVHCSPPCDEYLLVVPDSNRFYQLTEITVSFGL